MRKSTMVAVVLALAAFALPASAKTYYVKANGKDVAPTTKNKAGLSVDTAFKTIQFAIDNAAAGSTILVYPGTYAPIVSNDKKLTIKAVEGPDRTFISGSGSSASVVAQLGSFAQQAETTTLFERRFSDGSIVRYWENYDIEYPEEGWDWDAHWYGYNYVFTSKRPKKWTSWDPPAGVKESPSWGWDSKQKLDIWYYNDTVGTVKTGCKKTYYKGGKNTKLTGFSLRNGKRAVWGGTLSYCRISWFSYGADDFIEFAFDGTISFFSDWLGVVNLSTLSDCEVSDNEGTGDIVDASVLDRCTLSENRTGEDLVYDTTMNNCAVLENKLVGSDWSSPLLASCTLYNCTVAGNHIGSWSDGSWNDEETTEDDPDEGKWWDAGDGCWYKSVWTEWSRGSNFAVGWRCHVYNSVVFGNEDEDGNQVNVNADVDSGDCDLYDSTYVYLNAKLKKVTEHYDATSQFVNSCTDVLIDTSKNKKVKSTGNKDVNPLFVDPAAGNYGLVPWSECVDAGADYTKKTGKTDLAGGPRKVGAKVDMGAYEAQAGTPVPADYDGDGQTDPALYFAETGEWWIWGSLDFGSTNGWSGATPTVVKFGGPKGAVPLAADFDGYGKAEPAYFAAAEKEPFFVRLSGDMWGDPVTNKFATYKDATGKAVSAKGATPVAARLSTKNKKSTFGVYASTAKAPVYFFLGKSKGIGGDAKLLAKGSKPVVADFTGDGVDDLGAYTSGASTPAFTVLKSNESWSLSAPFEVAENAFYPTARRSVALGAKGSIPCCADFDGDGLADFAAYSSTASEPAFSRLFSTSKYSETRTLPMGLKGDVPVVGFYEPVDFDDPGYDPDAPRPANMAVFTGKTWRYCTSSFEDVSVAGWGSAD